ncbi:hypothetical protein RJ55_02849 [Drechmeria coniospora]|nr:hypothetical protein RJ55_02849 [Drechmeria coniospora]
MSPPSPPPLPTESPFPSQLWARHRTLLRLSTPRASTYLPPPIHALIAHNLCRTTRPPPFSTAAPSPAPGFRLDAGHGTYGTTRIIHHEPRSHLTLTICYSRWCWHRRVSALRFSVRLLVIRACRLVLRLRPRVPMLSAWSTLPNDGNSLNDNVQPRP